MSDDPSGFDFDPQMFANIPLFKELSKLLSWQGGPVNWELARQTAEGIAGKAQRAIGPDADSAAWGDAVRVAESWLDPVMTLPAVIGPARAMTVQEWVAEAASEDGIARFVEPIASGMQESLGRVLRDQLPEGMDVLGGLGGAMGPMTAMFTGMQVGTIAGHLAGQLMGGYDLGVPTLSPRTVAMVGGLAASVAHDHAIDPTEFRFWLALRESVHRRVFAGVEWPTSHISEQMRAFAAAGDFDPTSMMGSMDLGSLGPEVLRDPDALQRLAEDAGEMGMEPTDEQRRISAGLQALVSLVAGYADVMVSRAAEGRLPSIARIEEVTRRRRAEAGAGERFLTQMVGLDLRPQDTDQGRRFCEAVLAARGPRGMDVVWRDPAHLPTPAEIDDPSRWLLRLAAEEAEEGTAALADDLSLEDVEIPDDLAGLDDA